MSSQLKSGCPRRRHEISIIYHLLARDDFDAEAVIGFPDDDAWYPPGALACVAQQFQSSPELELLLSRYGPAPSVTACTGAFRPTLQQALSRSACAAGSSFAGSCWCN